MIAFIVIAILILVATVSAAYSLTLLDRIVHGNLYSYGLRFDLDWANPYWTILRITLALLVVVAVFTLVNMVFIYRNYAHQKQLELKADKKAKVILAHKKEVIQPQPQLAPIQTPKLTLEPTTQPMLQPTPHPSPQPTSQLSHPPTHTPMPPPLQLQPQPQPQPQPIPRPTLRPEAPPVSTTHTPPTPTSETKVNELMAEIRKVSTVQTSPVPPQATVPSAPGLIHCSHCRKTFSQPLRMLDFHGDRPRMINICPFCNEVVQSTLGQDETEQNRREEHKKKRDNNKTPETVVTPTLDE